MALLLSSILIARENTCAVFGDQDCMFKLCREAFVRRGVPLDGAARDFVIDHARRCLVQHGFNCDHSAWEKAVAAAFFPEARNKRFIVEFTPDPVATDFANDMVTKLGCELINRKTDITRGRIFTNGLNSHHHGLFCGFRDALGFVADVSNVERRRRVAKEAVFESSDIDIDDVALFENGAVRNTVTDYFVHRGARVLGVTVVANTSRLRPVRQHEVVCNQIEFVCRDPRANVFARVVKRLRCQLAYAFHSADFFWGINWHRHRAGNYQISGLATSAGEALKALPTSLPDYFLNDEALPARIGLEAGFAVGFGITVGPGFGVATGAAVGRGIAVGTGIGGAVGLGTGVATGLGVAVGFGVGTTTGLGTGVATGFGVGFGVGTGVAVGFGVGTGVATGFGVGTGVATGFGVGAGVATGFGVGTGVGIGVGTGVAAGAFGPVFKTVFKTSW